MTRGLRACVLAGLLALAIPAAPCRADNGLVGGIVDLVSGVFAIPMGVLGGTFSGPPIIGTVGGALQGTLQAVSLAARGTLKLVGVAVPLAAKVVPLIPLFL